MSKRIKVLFTCLLLVLAITCSVSLQVAIPDSSFATVASASAELNRYSLYITKGETYQLKIKNAKGKVKWSSDDSSIASVSQKGVVKAKKKGKAVIKAVTSSNILFCYVTVETPKISKSSMTLIKGTNYDLSVKGTYQTVKWSTSNKKIAKVSKYGTVYAKKAGNATITATVGSKEYTCQVKVEAPTLSNKTLILEPGKQYTLKLSGTTKTVKWYSSNKTTATITQAGVITAKQKGYSTITAKVGSTSYTCSLTVEKPALSETNTVLIQGDSKWLRVSDTYQDKTWSSSNPNVATVDEYGDVQSVGTGKAVISCNLGYKTLSCNVTVENPTLSQTELTLNEGDIVSLMLNGTSQEVEWSSYNDSIASVSENGVVTAKKEGSTSIYAKIGTKRYTCDVTVKEAPIDMSLISATYYDTGKGIVGIFRNSYKESIRLEMTVLYYDANGNLIDQRSNEIYAFATGKEAALEVVQPYDSNTWEDLEYSNYKVVLKASKSYYPNSQLGNDNILIEATDTGSKVIVKATNNSSNEYSFIKAAIVFFDSNGRCIGFDDAYMDCNSAFSSDYKNFDYPYDRENHDTIKPASYKVYLNYAY